MQFSKCRTVRRSRASSEMFSLDQVCCAAVLSLQGHPRTRIKHRSCDDDVDLFCWLHLLDFFKPYVVCLSCFSDPYEACPRSYQRLFYSLVVPLEAFAEISDIDIKE